MKKIKWEHILLFFLELLVNMATVGVAILLNALIDAAQISITSQDAHHLQKVLFISILYAVCLGVLIFLSNRYKACYIRKRLLEMRTVLADGTLQSSIANYEETGNASYVTAFNQNFSIIEEKVLQNRISILDSVICIVFAVLVLLYMNPLISVISIAAMAIPSLLPSLFTKVLGTAQETVMKSTTSYNETVADLLTGYEVIKTYHAEDEMFHKFSKTAKRLDSNKEHFSSLMASVYGLTTLSSVAVQFQNVNAPAHQLVIVRLVTGGAPQLRDTALLCEGDPDLRHQHPLHIQTNDVHSPLLSAPHDLCQHIVQHLLLVDDVPMAHRPALQTGEIPRHLCAGEPVQPLHHGELVAVAAALQRPQHRRRELVG